MNIKKYVPHFEMPFVYPNSMWYSEAKNIRKFIAFPFMWFGKIRMLFIYWIS